MSLEELSIGNELRDQYKGTAKWINNGGTWLSDIEEFYKERANIEREYSTRLLELCKKHFDRKAKNSSHLSVGDDPHITPGSLESASVVLWNEVLTQTEAIAKERDGLANEINTKICQNLNRLQTKTLHISARIDGIHTFLELEKKAVNEDVNKAKKNYDALCQSTENARQKTEKLASEKYQAKLREKEVDMNMGKNNYLIRISVANRLKDKYYFQDLPEVLDYFQELNESRVAILNKLLKNASIIERNSNDKVKELLHVIDATVDQNNPKLDTAMYIKHNAVAWKEPGDFYFIPCDFWHDDETLITKEPELTELRRRLNSSLNSYSVAKESTIVAKQRLEESAVARKDSADALTLKFDVKFDEALTLLQRFMKEDLSRVKSEVEIEIIQNFAGDQDLSYVEQKKEKKSKFGFLKSHNTAASADNGDAHSIHTVASNITSHSGGLFSLRRNKTITSESSLSSKAKVLYAYEAAGDDEISLLAGDILEIIEEDDGSGWTTLRSGAKQGLAPTSYLEITREQLEKKKGPSVAPKRGAKKVQYVEALYDYAADEDNELAIQAGDRIVLIQDDTDGSGWTEGELDGRRGLFPTSYVKKI